MTEYIQMSGADIKRIVDKVHSVLSDEDNNLVMMACIVIAIGIHKPDITINKMVEGVKGVSEWISLFVSTPDTLDVDPSRMN